MMILESDSLPAHSLKSFILLIIVFHFNLILQFMKNKQSGSTTTYVQLTFWSFDSNFPGQYAAGLTFRNTNNKKRNPVTLAKTLKEKGGKYFISNTQLEGGERE